MSPFFETLKIENGKILNLYYHNLRLNKTIYNMYGKKSDFNLEEFINIPDAKTYRCKVIYNTNLLSFELLPYKPKVFKSFKLIDSDIDYTYKSTDREELNKLFKLRNNCDDILIIKDGLLTDTSIANIAIFDGEQWFTPKKPLLFGTQRAKLLEDKIVVEKDIKVKDIKNIVNFAIMNALIGFHKIEDVKFYF
jgi:4-amino-4-deoxychorismate lyase